ncbi:Protein kinase superfamily protein [Rhynchospora pubera]|uniref:non-specific serine/threonine protein kinase n=1 Tax=Rhynchospora pubera TaxID=906938 RepID=A0AAV8EMI8_9POAL|nr:Protein kinase superfamily protein [Rhynchospora pubera]
MSNGDLSSDLMKRTTIFNLKVWVLIAICFSIIILLILLILTIWATNRRRRTKLANGSNNNSNYNSAQHQIPTISKEITVDQVGGGTRTLAQSLNHPFEADKEQPCKTLAQLALNNHNNSVDYDNMSQCSSICFQTDKMGSSHSGEELNGSGLNRKNYSPVSASPLIGLPEFSQLGWGHWFTLRDLEYATNRFSKDNVLGEGGYGVVYHGRLVNGTEVAIKRIFNNMGQAEKEFRVEVEAIGHVRHKNLVRLLGYCVEGVNRMLVYEYVNNGNLEQWLHGAMRHRGVLSWESRIKIISGTAKALAYLHEAIEPKVVHRDIKTSNILIDNEFNGKVSDFGLAKLLGSDKSHVTTRVMGTFGYVAPEYANTGMLNEKSDVYSFGIVLLETVTGRDPVDYSRPANEVTLVDWLKVMVSSRRAEEVVDPALEVKPSTRSLKRILLVALRCVDPDSEKRPRMGQVVRMLESDDLPHREDRRSRRSHGGSMDNVILKESSTDVESSDNRT